MKRFVYLWLTHLTYSFSLERVGKANMSASSPSNDCSDLLLISTMNRAFDAALPLLATGIADKDRIAEIRVSLSRTLIELISCGVTEYSELLRLALESSRRAAQPSFGTSHAETATPKGQSDRNPGGRTRIEDHGAGSRPEILFKTRWCRIRVRRKLGARAQLVRSSAAKPCFRRVHAGVCGRPRSR